MSGQSSLPSGPGPSPADQVTGERHVSSVAGRSGSFTKRKGVVLVVCATGAALSFLFLKPQGSPPERDQASEDRLKVQAVARYEPPPPLPVSPVSYAIPRPSLAAPVAPTQQTLMPRVTAAPPDPLLKARHASLLAYGGIGGGNGGQQQRAQGEGGPARLDGAPPSELAARLQATPVNTVGASVLPHQPYLLTKGNVLPCVLQTAMDSTLPGLVTCKLPSDVIGKTGITLLDRGTLVVGESQGGMQQGQSRLFVLWTRAETPKGIVINLDSPAADPLGRTGFDGETDTHFWTRLGGALLLSVVQGALQAGVASVSPQGGTTINTGSIDNLAAESLRGSVGVRPTLKKNQGELVSIFVARDLDFSGPYSVSLAPGVVGAQR